MLKFRFPQWQSCMTILSIIIVIIIIISSSSSSSSIITSIVIFSITIIIIIIKNSLFSLNNNNNGIYIALIYGCSKRLVTLLQSYLHSKKYMVLASDTWVLWSVVCTSHVMVTVSPAVFFGKVRFMLKVRLEMLTT